MSYPADSGAFRYPFPFDEVSAPWVGKASAGPCPACGRRASRSRCGECGATRSAGRYRTLKVIGQRSFSRTYLALDPKYDQHVVLKELWFAQVPSVQELRVFEREAALLASVDHRRIPRMLKAFQEGSGRELRLYLVRKYVAGTSLSVLVRNRRLDERQAQCVARQVLRVLMHLHAHQPPIVHRDLRPHHLLRATNGDIHLLGFDAARWIEEGLELDGTLVGQVGYASFEQLGGTLEATADLHGLGATLLHLVTGTDPFEMMPDGQRVELPRDLPVSPAFAGFIRRLVAPPSRRYASAQDAYAALTSRSWLADVLESAAAWVRRR